MGSNSPEPEWMRASRECRPGRPSFWAKAKAHRESPQRTIGTAYGRDGASIKLVLTSCMDCGATISRPATPSELEADLRKYAAAGAIGRSGPVVMSRRFRIVSGLLVGLPVGIVVAVLVVGAVYLFGNAALGGPILDVLRMLGVSEQVAYPVLMAIMGLTALAIIAWFVVLTPETITTWRDDRARTEAYVAKHLGEVRAPGQPPTIATIPTEPTRSADRSADAGMEVSEVYRGHKDLHRSIWRALAGATRRFESSLQHCG